MAAIIIKSISLFIFFIASCSIDSLFKEDNAKEDDPASPLIGPDSGKADEPLTSEWSVCNYTDDPTCWSCRIDETQKEHCKQISPVYPNDNGTWVCWDENGKRYCKDNSQNPAESNSNWDCSFVAGQGNTCTKKDSDLPDNEHEWECHDEQGIRYCDEAFRCELGTIIGTICDANGRTLAGIIVTAYVNQECSDSPILTTTTDTAGNFEFSSVPTGSVRVTVDRNGVISEYTLTVSKGNKTKLVDDNCSRGQNEPDAGTDTYIEEPDTTVPDVPVIECRYGNVSGRVCSPSGILWLNDALVYIDVPAYCDQPARRIQTLTEADGRFSLEGIPAGQTYQLHVEKGSFNRTYEVPITADQIYVIPETELCLEQPRIAVVQGNYDAIERTLDDLSLEYTLFSDSDSSAPNYVGDLLAGSYATNRLHEFDIVFFNCGRQANNGTYPYGISATTVQQNMRDFLNAGKSIYASDWAFTLVKLLVPTEISAVKSGTPGITISDADILTGPIETFIGHENVQIYYNLANWYVIQSLNTANFTTHIVGDHSSCSGGWYYSSSYGYYCPSSMVNNVNNPLLVSRRYGTGKLTYTTFHQEANMTPDMENILKYMVFML